MNDCFSGYFVIFFFIFMFSKCQPCHNVSHREIVHLSESKKGEGSERSQRQQKALLIINMKSN